MSFEADMRRLEEINTMLKDPGTGLEKAIELYEEGSALTRKLANMLDEVKRRIERVENGDNEQQRRTPLDEDGNPAGPAYNPQPQNNHVSNNGMDIGMQGQMSSGGRGRNDNSGNGDENNDGKLFADWF